MKLEMNMHMYDNIHTRIQVNPVAQWWSFDSVKKPLAIKENIRLTTCWESPK